MALLPRGVGVGDLLGRVEALQRGLVPGHGQGRPVVGRVDRPGVQGAALGDVAGQQLVPVLLQAPRQQLVGRPHVVPQLALADVPPLFRSVLHDVVELGAVQPEAEDLLNPAGYLRFRRLHGNLPGRRAMLHAAVVPEQ